MSIDERSLSDKLVHIRIACLAHMLFHKEELKPGDCYKMDRNEFFLACSQRPASAYRRVLLGDTTTTTYLLASYGVASSSSNGLKKKQLLDAPSS
jgi:hypothetical protein